MDDSEKVVVAMSGGVDSSVAALLLHEQGREVIGVSMQVWDYRSNGGCDSKATCCSPDDFTDARKVAARIDIPYYVFDFEKTFRSEVIDRFVRTYESGRTPNPCVDCNSRVKFRELRGRADALGFSTVATGHYARIEGEPGQYRLLRGVDREKDQSYFLYGLTQAELSKTVFPVGSMTKTEVRERAESAGLSTASKPESQDICFVSGTVSDFLVRIGSVPKRGPIVDRSGTVLGQHDGIQNFTVGQRRGIGIGGATDALYVLEIIPESHAVVVGSREELERSEFAVHEVNWIAPALLEQAQREEGAFDCIVQLRHRHSGVPARVVISGTDSVNVQFTGEWSPVSPGQAAVFYDATNTEVLGGGRIV